MLPPIEEQRRIAALLDRTNALQDKRRASEEKLALLSESIFLHMFSDPIANPRRWPVQTIGDLLESATYGTSRKADTDGALPILRMGNITMTGEVDLTDLKWIELPGPEIRRHTVRRGDILFNLSLIHI